jgi:hypothetical protein
MAVIIVKPHATRPSSHNNRLSATVHVRAERTKGEEYRCNANCERKSPHASYLTHVQIKYTGTAFKR